MTMTMPAPTAAAAPPWQGLFERLLAGLGSRDGAEWDRTESRLDPAIYHDRERHGAELVRLFRGLPLCLGHADQFAEPGTVLARDIAGLPLLMMRGPDGAIGVFLNVCRHRGARLVPDQDAPCRLESLSCRYHGWTYDLAGALVAVPRREAFPTLDAPARGLRKLPAVVRHGLIWALLDPAGAAVPDMAGYLGELDRDLELIGIGQHRVFRQHAVRRATNWKLVVDAFLEVYHLKRLHADTIGPFFVDTGYVTDQVGPHQRYLVARDGTAELRALPPEAWSPQRHGTLVHFVFPNTLLVYHPDYISHLAIFPAAPDESLFVHTMLIPHAPRSEKEAQHWERSYDLMDRDVFNGEDLFICEQIQLGVASGANDSLLLGRFENNVRCFHAAIDAALA